MTSLSLLAPAKLNLGLEVLGRRPDGYHEIATVMQTVSVFDRLTFTPSNQFSLHCCDPDLAGLDNLILKAAHELRLTLGVESGAAIRLRKRIPTAAGLGGASSDAAATLTALARLWHGATGSDLLRTVAARVGSDVPFLLSGGTALARGRGEDLTALPCVTGVWFVLVVPPLQIPRKTATLYALLREADLSSGSRMEALAKEIEGDRALPPELLANAFLRPLLALHPEFAVVEKAMVAAGAPFVALSGAGPAHYTVVTDPAPAIAIARNLRGKVEPGTRILLARPVARAPIIRIGDG